MKEFKLKIQAKPLFNYTVVKNQGNPTESTDPTTTVLTLTKTGIFQATK
jgi:hypothetical protein